MKRALLDVNILLALLDQDHVHHSTAWSWLEAQGHDGWATCAITQNGFVRVITQPRYPRPLTTIDAVELLAQACAGSEHAYWHCDISLLDPSVIDARRMHSALRVTDTYLLALAVASDGRLVTLDRDIPLNAVHGATTDHLLVL